MSMNAPTVFSRILLVIAALSVIGLTYWFIATSLAPISVPPPSTNHGTVHFDPAADITKHAEFSRMRLLGPTEVVPANLGRRDPFLPVPKAVSASSTTSTSVTSAGIVKTTSTISVSSSSSRTIPILPQVRGESTGTTVVFPPQTASTTPQIF